MIADDNFYSEIYAFKMCIKIGLNKECIKRLFGFRETGTGTSVDKRGLGERTS